MKPLASRLVPWGLSPRLLLLTVAFVMLGVVLIYAPTIASFRLTYLGNCIIDAHIAALALSEPSENRVSETLSREILESAHSYRIVLRRPNSRALVLSRDMPHETSAMVDLRDAGLFMPIADAFVTLAGDGERMLRVTAPAPNNPEALVETVIDEASLRAEMLAFSKHMLAVSFVIALIAAGLVYLSLQLLLVRPMQRITANVTAFRKDPEDPRAAVNPSGRSDEIGRVERELAHMQEGLLSALRQRARLAQLGGAMAKINHDLRNILASAQLVSDTVSASDDPKVKRVAPTLLGAIDRAIALCTQTITFAAGGTQLPVKRGFVLKALVDEVFDIQGAGTPRSIVWANRIGAAVQVTADRGQMYRVLTNLARNAAEAGATAVAAEVSSTGGWTVIDIIDDGPGLPPRALERLFQPFAGSTRPGGTGLGLAIARELMHVHGGEIELAETGAKGTRFRLTLPRMAGENASTAAAKRPTRLRLRG